MKKETKTKRVKRWTTNPDCRTCVHHSLDENGVDMCNHKWTVLCSSNRLCNCGPEAEFYKKRETK